MPPLPVAVMVLHDPGHTLLFVVVTVGPQEVTITCTVPEPLPHALVTVTVYVDVDAGVTVIAEDVCPPGAQE